MSDYDVIHVHIDNPEDLQAARTQEVEPEYFSFQTFVIFTGGTGNPNMIQQILTDDPYRKDWSISAIDQPLVLCDSFAQANSARNQDANVPFPEGAYIPQGGSFTFTGTGKAWIVAVNSTPNRVAVAINRRARV